MPNRRSENAIGLRDGDDDPPKLPTGRGNTLAARLKMAMRAAGFRNASELARKMGIPRATISSWLTGTRSELTPAYLFLLADTLDCNARWIALGFPASPVRLSQLDPEEKAILELFRALPEQARDSWATQGHDLLRLLSSPSRTPPFRR